MHGLSVVLLSVADASHRTTLLISLVTMACATGSSFMGFRYHPIYRSDAIDYIVV